MARILSVSTDETRVLDAGWTMTVAEAGAFAGPAEAAAAGDWIPAVVPGTAAAALTRAGRFDPAHPTPLADRDVWYRVRPGAEGRFTLRCAGLATVAEVHVDGALVAESRSMFVPLAVDVTLHADSEIAIVFRSLAASLTGRAPRARWRPQMIPRQDLRRVRTTLLGHMPGWCPEIHAVGPYRPVTLTRHGALRLSDLRIDAAQTAEGGRLAVSVAVEGSEAEARLVCGGHSIPLGRPVEGRLAGSAVLAGVEAWWPAGHGGQALHPVRLEMGGATVDLGRVGFRSLEVDRGADGAGFQLRVNGVRVFCRGAVWTSADLLGLGGDRATYEPWLRLAAEAGMTMVRIPGVATYETPAFFDLCDELGLLVWQDAMLANFDYPTDPSFQALVAAEMAALLADLQGTPSLAVVSGGSEVHQQAAMMGLPPAMAASPLYDSVLPQAVAAARPDVAYVPNSPFGGALPFVPDTGIAHYYGVGAYGRGLDDLRRTRLRFAAECLAFANVPAASSLATDLAVPAVHHPAWKAGVPRDLSATWDFEDVRDVYLEMLFGLDPARLRREDGARYLDLSRRVGGAVMEAAFAEWRRPGSETGGALVFTLMDLAPGAGWGVVAADGTPKPAWHALRRAFRPLALTATDEGTAGLALHLVNDGPDPVAGTLVVTCLRDGAVPVVTRRRAVELAPRSGLTLSAYEIIGSFFDVTYAYRFGPPAHDVTVVRLLCADGTTTLAETHHRPAGAPPPGRPVVSGGLFEGPDGGWQLRLSADRYADGITVDAPGFRPSDDWFFVAPGADKAIDFLALRSEDRGRRPSGTVRLGSDQVLLSFD